MKCFLTKIILFFIAIAVIDILFGQMCQYMNDHSKGGGVKSRYYICKESREDVLIFGSSRAKHHYVPEIIEDSLDLTCYNAGEDGNGIILCYGFLKMITQRYSPKLIIYDVTGFDMYEDDNMKYLDLLKPYYHEPGIDSIFWAVNSKSRFMMMSNLYRFNTTCLRVIGNFLHPMASYPKGYCALYKTMEDFECRSDSTDENGETEDSLKLHYFEEFIRLALSRDIFMICCVSPSYKSEPDDSKYNPIKLLCSQYGIPFLYNEAEPSIAFDKSFFQDRTHMNDLGARKYTNFMISSILSNYSRNKNFYNKSKYLFR